MEYQRLTRQFSDLAGNCPEDSNAYCKANGGGPTFSANEPLFWQHHAVSWTFRLLSLSLPGSSLTIHRM